MVVLPGATAVQLSICCCCTLQMKLILGMNRQECMCTQEPVTDAVDAEGRPYAGTALRFQRTVDVDGRWVVEARINGFQFQGVSVTVAPKVAARRALCDKYVHMNQKQSMLCRQCALTSQNFCVVCSKSSLLSQLPVADCGCRCCFIGVIAIGGFRFSNSSG